MTITTSPTTTAATRPRVEAAPRTKPRRSPKMAGLGIALVAVAGLSGAWLANQGGQTAAVVALKEPIRAGERVTAEQLGSVNLPVGTGLDTIAAEDLSSLVGKYANTNLPKGALVAPSQLQDGLYPPAGQSVVGVALKPTQMPARGLIPGDKIRLVVGDNAIGGVRADKSGTAWDGTVIAVGAATDDGTTTVDVQVATADAGGLAAASGGGNLAVILDAGSANAAAVNGKG